MRQLYDLTNGNTPLQIMSWEALAQRTMPVGLLQNSISTLQVGKSYEINELIEKLNNCGYSQIPRRYPRSGQYPPPVLPGKP